MSNTGVGYDKSGRSRARALVRTARLCPRIGNSKIWQPAGNERRAELLGRLAEISIGWRIFQPVQ